MKTKKRSGLYDPIFTKQEIAQAKDIISACSPPHDELLAMVLPLMERINQQLGIENDADFMAFLLEYTVTMP